jgi:7-cyano-7-deazaguanine synthase in queuosine biosynthesis
MTGSPHAAPIPPPVAVLLGGGVESTLIVSEFLRGGRQVIPVHVHCGLLWDDAEAEWVDRFLATRSCDRLHPLLSTRLPLAGFLGDHWAVHGRDVPPAGAPGARLEIPLRNLTLLGIAVHALKSRRGDDGFGNHVAGAEVSVPYELALGTTADNHYADGSRDYFDRCEAVLSLEAGFPVRILTPLIGLHKREVLARSDAETLALSFSCVNPCRDPSTGWPEHCGQCIKCGSRRAAFREAGLVDPTRYAAESP